MALPNHRVVMRRDASVKSGPAGTSSGLFGFLLRAVIASLLQAYSATANAAADPALKKVLLIMLRIFPFDYYGVIRTLRPHDRGFAMVANSIPWLFPV